MKVRCFVKLKAEIFCKLVQVLVDQGNIPFSEIAIKLGLQSQTIKKIYLGNKVIKNSRVHYDLVDLFLETNIPRNELL
jgi:hypothetical protein